MTGTTETPVGALYDAYYSIGEEICQRLGNHDYKTIQPENGVGPSFERCERCHHYKEWDEADDQQQSLGQ